MVLSMRQKRKLGEDELVLSREGLLRVDSLLNAFFLPEHRGVRYA